MRLGQFFLFSLVFNMVACGGQSDSPPKSQPGTDDQRAASAPAQDKPEKAAPPATPATLEQALQAIDLRQMPKLEGARVQMNKAAWLVYSAPGRLADAAEVYRKKLTELGWTEDKTPFPGINPDKYIFASFDKAGFHLTLGVSKSDQKEGMIDVNLMHYGNVDPRALPRLPDAKPTMAHWHYLSYTTAAKPEAVIEFYRKEMTARGWREYRVSLAKFHAKEGRFLLGFVNNAMSLFLNIKGTQDGQTVVECRAEVRDKVGRTVAKDMPKPATFSEGKKVIDLNRFPRLEGAAPGEGSSALLHYDAPGSVAEALSFYRKKLSEQGWTEESGSHEDDTNAIVKFAKTGFQLDFFIGKSNKAARVNVQIENKGNVDARQLPRISEAEDGSAESFGDVRYETGATIAAAADFYRNELPKMGWKEYQGKDGSKDHPRDSGQLLVFEQNASTLKIEIGPDSEGEIGVHIIPHLYGDFIARPGRPEEAQAVIDLGKFPSIGGVRSSSATSAAVNYMTSGPVAEGARFYRQQLAKAGWRELRPTPLETDDRARLRFEKKGFILEVSLMLGEPRGLGVSVANRGNLNTRRLLHLEDAKVVEAGEPEHTRYTTGATVDAAVDFYRQEMPKFGWQLSKGPETTLSHIELVFVQKPIKLVIHITTNAEKKTEVQVESWVLDEPAASADKPKAAGPRPKDFLIPDDAEDAEFNASTNTVHFKSPSTIRKLVDFYRKELKSRGWSEDQNLNILELTEIGVCTFKKEKASFTLTFNRADKTTEVTVICKGAEWK